MGMDNKGNPSEYDKCPECNMPFFFHDKNARRHICVNQECGYAVDDDESIWTKLLRLLRLKK